MSKNVNMLMDETACKQCIHDSDPYYCGSFCMYGDCFEPIVPIKDNLQNENLK